MDTAKIAEPISGNKLYQKRARQVLPILVRQAEAGETIYYSALAEEIGIPNPRNLNYVLGSIGTTMENLSKSWKIKVPPIQCLVINKKDGLPGEGIGWFLIKKQEFSSLSKRKKRKIVEAELQHIFSYRQWQKVLSALSLEPVRSNFTDHVKKASSMGGGGVESDEHKRLKEYIAEHPNAIGLSANILKGQIEFQLSSGDKPDVHFQHKKDWIAVEVKSSISNEADIVRGIFQCIKYKAVMEAMQLASGLPQNARSILVLENTLPSVLISLKNLLGIEVIEKVYEKG